MTHYRIERQLAKPSPLRACSGESHEIREAVAQRFEGFDGPVQMGPQRIAHDWPVLLVACCSLEVAGHQQAQERGKTIANLATGSWLPSPSGPGYSSCFRAGVNRRSAARATGQQDCGVIVSRRRRRACHSLSAPRVQLTPHKTSRAPNCTLLAGRTAFNAPYPFQPPPWPGTYDWKLVMAPVC